MLNIASETSATVILLLSAVVEVEHLLNSFLVYISYKEQSSMEQPLKGFNYFSIFKYCTNFEKSLLFVGAFASIGAGSVIPILYTYIGSFVNDIVDNIKAFQNETLSNTEKDEYSRRLHESATEFVITVCGLGFVVLVCSFTENETFNYVSLKQILRLRTLYFEKVLNQDVSWYDTCKSNPLSSDLTENFVKLEDGIGEKVPTFLSYFGMFFTCIIVALVSGWELALICLISLPACTVAIGLSTWVSIKIMTKFVKDELNAYSAAGSIAEEVFTAIKTVVAFEGQQKERERYSNEVKIARDNNRKRALFSSTGQGVVWLLIFSCYGLSFWYGFRLIERDTLAGIANGYTPGKLMTVFFSAMGASVAFASASPLLETFKLSTEIAERIFKVMEHEPTINVAKTKGVKIESPKGSIVFKNVSFNYPSRSDVEVLNNFNLEIRPGETIALVGSSGSGKSTVIQLLLRLYDPTRGTVMFDGVNLKDLNLDWLRNALGTVLQEPVLFDATIKENILFGNLNASQEDVQIAAQRADLHDFIVTLPKGYDTPIRATKMSGGQKQRIAIARALVRKPTILLFDEATSALDTESEALVQAALEEASKLCTTIIVAHRLSTIRHANKIVVMNEGKIVEQGTHSELITLKGHYYKFATQPAKLVAGVESNLDEEADDYTKEDTMRKDEEVASPNTISLAEKSLFKKVIKTNAPEKWHIVLGAAAAFLNSASLPIYAILFGDIMQTFAMENLVFVEAIINQYCMFFLFLGIFSGLTTFLQTYMLQIAGENLTMRLRISLFESFMKQEMAWFDESENSVGSLCAILAGESAGVQAASGVCIGTILNSTGTLILCVAVAFYYHWKLALVCFAIPGVALLIVIGEQFASRKNQGNLQKSVESSAKLALEAVSNIRTIASLTCEKRFLDKYQKQLVGAYGRAIKATIFHSFSNACFKAMPVFTYGVCIYYGVYLISNEHFQYGTIFKVTESVLLASMTVASTMAFTPNVTKALRAAKRIFRFISHRPKITTIKNASATDLWSPSNVCFSKVHFSYPTRPTVPVLRGFDLRVLQGKSVALVGASGCGKSTIVQLLERFYDPIGGSVSIGDCNIKTADVDALRYQMGIVSQEPNLFDRTIAENIAYGDNRRGVGMDEIIEVAEVANIHAFIATLPLGYDTRIGEKGTQLSGGQKQRIAIARALIRKPQILLLDEATSALDSESEKMVQEALNKTKVGKTCIMIAHRLSTIQDADVICVVHDGKVAEMGRHAYLISKKGLYFHYYSLQQ